LENLGKVPNWKVYYFFFKIIGRLYYYFGFKLGPKGGLETHYLLNFIRRFRLSWLGNYLGNPYSTQNTNRVIYRSIKKFD